MIPEHNPSPKPRFQAVIFDFDYTLADSSRGIIECVNYALDRLHLPPVTPDQILSTIGLSLPDTFRALTGATEGSAEFVRLFVQRGDKVMMDKTVLLEPVPQVVSLLDRPGLALGIVSTKFRRRIESVLARDQLLSHFDVIIGGEDVPRHKPEPDGLLLALERLGLTPSDSIYVGDSTVDAETARRAGIPFVAVLSGTTPRDAFEEYPVIGILESISGLPGWLE
jgi:phosphoglycolate phosphatase